MKRGILFWVFIVSVFIVGSTNFSFAQSEYNLTYDNNGNLIQGSKIYYRS